MELITNSQTEQLLANGRAQRAAIDRQDQALDFKPVVKLFTPDAQCTRLLTEIDEGTDLAFGLCDLGLGCPELGYVSLLEQRVRTVASSPDVTLTPPAFGSAVYLPQQAPCDSHMCAGKCTGTKVTDHRAVHQVREKSILQVLRRDCASKRLSDTLDPCEFKPYAPCLPPTPSTEEALAGRIPIIHPRPPPRSLMYRS